MHGHMRFRMLGALVAGTLIAGIGVGVSSGLVTTSSHPHPNPTIAVSPHAGLVDLQKVLLVGSHFSRNALVGTVECSSSAVDESGCDLSTLVYGNADSKGALTLRRYVRRIITVGAGPIDCALGAQVVRDRRGGHRGSHAGRVDADLLQSAGSAGTDHAHRGPFHQAG